MHLHNDGILARGNGTRSCRRHRIYGREIIDVRIVGLNLVNSNPLRRVQNIPVLYPTRIRVFFNISVT